MTIPRDADPQYRYARPIARSALRPGDLLFFGSRSYVEHVSIYVGGGRMLEAPDSAHRVRIVPIRWTYFVGAGRI
jgi:cell wall-associated NlpC family hydrolase